MDQETAERLLGSPIDDHPDGPRSLVVLLSAIRAAPRDEELAGENAALQAYRRARSGSPLALPARRRRGRATVRAAWAGVLVAASGGVAFAAAGGDLPHPLRPPAPTTAPSATDPGAPGASPTADPDTGSGTPAPGDRPTRAASLAGLCRAYRADAGGDPGRPLDNPVFGDLVGAAGGRERVPGYCDRVLTASAGPDASTARPGDRATDPPADRSGTGSTHRPGVPTGLPSHTGRPATPRSVPSAPGTARRTADPDEPPGGDAVVGRI
ncbi:hypothetical protein D7223_17635 [Micromonospora endolithica]|uniref:Uncharacterized protein n=2 Tax=Micromonospora endolithica TaxID=230091 RepID=A0A3A9ZAS8_9ACTN|nr:hypothetical protein D7223_17635 [Micromonospora endolithica]TWJ22860.1 hypothetical protein JD76_02983 [Micromonospora endolithica]